MFHIYILLTFILLFSGCTGKAPEPQEIVIRTVEIYIPTVCNIPRVIKPDYSGLNDVQKLYKDKEYLRALEARQTACDINITK